MNYFSLLQYVVVGIKLISSPAGVDRQGDVETRHRPRQESYIDH
jgi:hypothetical protein